MANATNAICTALVRRKQSVRQTLHFYRTERRAMSALGMRSLRLGLMLHQGCCGLIVSRSKCSPGGSAPRLHCEISITLCPLRVIRVDRTVDTSPLFPALGHGRCHIRRDVPCVDGSELTRSFFTFAALVGAAMCSAFRCGSHGRWP
jgi:hypothetical protein